MADEPEDVQLEKPLAQEPKAPTVFAGFLLRLAALFGDIVLIYFLGYTLEMTLRGPLLALGPMGLLFLSHLFVFLYFWLGNGPVGKGMTLGKAILNIRVVDAEGAPLGYGAGLRRALVQYPLVYQVTFMFIAQETGAPTVPSLAVTSLLEFLGLTLILTLAYSVIAHPQRRGWHDLFAGSYVTPNPVTEAFKDAAHAPMTEQNARRAAALKRTSVVFFLVIAVLFGLNWIRSVNVTRQSPAVDFIEGVEAAAPLPGYRLETFALTGEAESALFADYLRGIMPERPADDATTTTQNVFASLEGELTLRLFYIKKRGLADVADANDPELGAAIQQLRRAALERIPEFQQSVAEMFSTPRAQEALEEARENADDPLPSADFPTTPPQRISLLFADQFRFVLFSLGGDEEAPLGLRFSWAAQGPIDPAAGPLEYERVTPPGRGRKPPETTEPTRDSGARTTPTP